MTDASDRIPWDVHAKLEDPMVRLAIALGHWEARDESKAQPFPRREASRAMDVIDALLGELYVMRSRLVSEDAAMARSEALLGEADVLAFCRGCRRSTRSVPCELCPGMTCAVCGRCPDCDGPVPDEEE